MVKRVKKKRVRWTRIFFALFFIIIVISIVVIGFVNYFDSRNVNEEKKNKLDETDIVENKETSLSLVMVGDALIHNKIYNEAKRIGNGNYNFSSMLSLIKPMVSKYDLAYYNQETILGGSEIGVSSYPAFNTPYEFGDTMIDAGFNLVSLATNHTLDRGEKAVINSRNYWNSKDDVLAVGSYSSLEERNNVQIREVNDITYTMLNYTYGTNGIKVPNGKDYLVNIWPVMGNNPLKDSNYQNYKKQVKEDIDSIRNNVDILIVAMHWGVEYQYEPNMYQKDMASYLASLGVDIIIGTHPHVIQPIEWIDDTLVIYSLGNFISAHEVINIGNRVGLMSSVKITKIINEDNSIDISINNLENELLYTYYTNNYQDILVIPFSSMEEKYLSNYREVYDKFSNIVRSINNDISIKPLG